MVAGKCGVEFREFFTCVFNSQDKVNDLCMPHFDKVEACIDKHSNFYQQEKQQNSNMFDDEEKTNSKVTLNSDNDVTLNSDNDDKVGKS